MGERSDLKLMLEFVLLSNGTRLMLLLLLLLLTIVLLVERLLLGVLLEVRCSW